MAGIVQELDIETGEVLFEWRSIDHVALDETYVTPLQDGRPGIDYFHINSIDVDHDDNLLVSARETSAVYRSTVTAVGHMAPWGQAERLRDGPWHPIRLPARRPTPARWVHQHLR